MSSSGTEITSSEEDLELDETTERAESKGLDVMPLPEPKVMLLGTDSAIDKTNSLESEIQENSDFYSIESPKRGTQNLEATGNNKLKGIAI